MNNSRAYPTLVIVVSLLGSLFLLIQHQLDIPSAAPVDVRHFGPKHGSPVATFHPILATNRPLPAARYAGHAESNDDAPTICAILNWVVQTNWTDAGAARTLLGWSGGPDPNVTTYYETGTTLSNLIARFDWKGESRGIVLESVVVGITNRAYTLSEQRNYK